MKGSSSNSPPAFSKAEAASMIAKLRSRSAGRTSAGQARSSKPSSASSTRRAVSPLQTGTSRATISPLLATKGQLRAQSEAAPAPPLAATGKTLIHPLFTFASPVPHSLHCGCRAGSQPGQLAENPCRVQLTPPGPPASPLQSTAPFVMTAEPAFSLFSFPAMSAIRQLRASRTAASQLSLSCAAAIMLPSAGGTAEAAHMAAAASQSPFAETPTPLSSDAADAAAGWADQLIDDVGSPGRATTHVAEPALPDVATLQQGLLCKRTQTLPGTIALPLAQTSSSVTAHPQRRLILMVPSRLSTSLQSALSSQMSLEMLLPPQEGQHSVTAQCLSCI